MRTFRDNAGRNWSVAVNVDAVRRLRTMAGVDLMELVQSDPAEDSRKRPLLERLLRDPILLADLLYVLCKEEADKLGVSDAEFGRALYGKVIVAARTALLEEIADFFPDEGRAIQRQADKLLGAYRKLIEQVDLRVQGYDEDQLVEAALAKMAAIERGLLPPTPGTSSTNWPENAESIPAD
jgi:hypothetical protein